MDEPTEAYQRLVRELEQARHQLHRKEVELKAVLAQSEEVASTDALTFLPNRRKIISSLQHEVLRSNRYRTPLALSMIDIDRFKSINDTHGHAVGDVVLQALARELRLGVRDSDLAGRLGGEEFLILLPNGDEQAAAQQAERLCTRVRALGIPVDDAVVHVTISIGVAAFRIGRESSGELLKRVDSAMYEAKRLGRDRWALAID